MSSLLGYAGNISGTTGATNVLEPKSSWKVYIFPQGAHATASSTGTVITLGSTEAASRLTTGHWVQVGTDPANVRRISAVAPSPQGNTVVVTSAVTVAANERIYLIGATQPTVSGSSVTYQPNTTIYPVDESENATPITESRITTDSNGLFQFWPLTAGFYDAMIQDSRNENQGSLIDINIGLVASPLVPILGRSDDIGSAALPWDDLTMSGKIISAVTSGSGVTYHRFDTTGGITGGALFQFANNGAMRLYGDSWGGILQSYTLPQVINVKSGRFSATGDGTTDDTTAIANALTLAAATVVSGVSGIVVYLPPGIYITNSTVEVPNRVILRGAGRRSSSIKAGGSLAANSALVRLGTAAQTRVFGCRIESLHLDCNDVAGTTALFSTAANEGSGAYDFLITKPLMAGIHFTTSNAEQFSIVDGEIYMSDSATIGSSSSGIIFDDSLAGSNEIRKVTVGNNAGSGTNSASGIRLSHSSGGQPQRLESLHVEGCSIGVWIRSNNVNLDCINGNNTVGTVVVIDPSIGNVNLRNINTNSATLGLSDSMRGFAIGTDVPWYSSSSIAFNQVISGVTGHAWGVQNPTTFGTTLTVSGTFGVTGSASLSGVSTLVGGSFTATSNVILSGGGSVLTQSGGVLTLSNGSWFGISGTGTAITSIAPVTSGRLVVLIASKGSQAFNDGAGLHVNGSPMTMDASGNPDSTMFFCAGTTWVQIGPQAA